MNPENSAGDRGRRSFRRRVGIVSLVVCIVGGAYAYGSLKQDDDLTSLLGAYSNALHGLENGQPDNDERVQFYQHWLSVLLAEYEKLPPEDVPEGARMTCLSLANGAQDYRLAESVAVDGITYARDWEQRLAYWDQRVGIRQAIAAQTGDPEDIASIGAVAEEAIAAIRPTLSDPLYATDSVSTMSVQRIFYVAAWQQASQGKGDEAADLMEQSAAFVDTIPASTLQKIGFTWWADQCLQNAARYRIEIGDIPGAIQTLRKIDTVGVRRVASSEHALICAGDVIPRGNFQDGFARAWLDQTDPWGPSEIRMAYALAFSISNAAPPPGNERLLEAVGILERLLSMKNVLAEADTAVAEPLLATGRKADNWVKEPVRSNALVTLATTYSALGMRDERAVIAGMVVTDYPKHPAIGLMEGMLD